MKKLVWHQSSPHIDKRRRRNHKKVYLKQKEKSTKGDWVELLKQDFEFIGQEQNDEEIVKMSKSD